MWKMIGRSFPNEDDYYRPRREIQAPGFCQPFGDGPLNNPPNPIEDTYLQLIASAQRFLYLTTPYYAVEESMQKALCIAADAGVDVRLMHPRGAGPPLRLPGGGDVLGGAPLPRREDLQVHPRASSTPRA
jgi:phosphatidylserine/phosphatidylglycerophosphate/cardiolipin synthase-like enzyme